MISGQTKQGDYWQGSTANQICVDVEGHGYATFKNVDEAVNTLYSLGKKDLARAINEGFKK